MKQRVKALILVDACIFALLGDAWVGDSYRWFYGWSVPVGIAICLTALVGCYVLNGKKL